MLKNGKIIMKKNRFFQNKYVLVTGSGSGIGHQIARDFLDLGSFVGVHYNSNRIGAQKLLKYAEKNKCKIFKSNLSKSKAPIMTPVTLDDTMEYSMPRVK